MKSSFIFKGLSLKEIKEILLEGESPTIETDFTCLLKSIICVTFEAYYTDT